MLGRKKFHGSKFEFPHKKKAFIGSTNIRAQVERNVQAPVRPCICLAHPRAHIILASKDQLPYVRGPPAVMTVGTLVIQVIMGN
jgi:hypothetical protein